MRLSYKGQGLCFESFLILAAARCILTIISIFFSNGSLASCRRRWRFFSKIDSMYLFVTVFFLNFFELFYKPIFFKYPDEFCPVNSLTFQKSERFFPIFGTPSLQGDSCQVFRFYDFDLNLAVTNLDSILYRLSQQVIINGDKLDRKVFNQNCLSLKLIATLPGKFIDWRQQIKIFFNRDEKDIGVISQDGFNVISGSNPAANGIRFDNAQPGHLLNDKYCFFHRCCYKYAIYYKSRLIRHFNG